MKLPTLLCLVATAPLLSGSVMAQSKSQPGQPRAVPPVSPTPTPEPALPGANAETPATPATPAKPANRATRGVRATPATLAVPATAATPGNDDAPDAPATEAEFLKMTGVSGRAAVKLVQLTATHSENAKVRAYAQAWMIDHQAGSDILADVNTSLKVTLPANDEPLVQRTFARLRGLHGEAFDQAFLK